MLGCLPLMVALNGEFVWTDTRQITDRGFAFDSFGRLWEFIHSGHSEYPYRPVVAAYNTLCLYVLGDAPQLFRLSNLAVHFLNACLLGFFLRRLAPASALGPATALLFAAHPVCVTVVAWTGARPDLLALTCLLLWAHAGLTYAERGRARWALLAGVALWFGLLTKEVAAAAACIPFAVAALTGPRRRLVHLGMVGGACVGLAAVILSNVDARLAIRDTGVNLGDRLLLFGDAMEKYLGYTALLVPASVCDALPIPHSWRSGWVLLLVGIALTVCACMRRSRPEMRWPLGGILWFVAFLVPVSGLIPLRHAMADRYLYIPLAGILAAATAVLLQAIRWRRAGRAVLGIGFCFFVLSGAKAAERGRRFVDDSSLWSWEIARNWKCAEAHSGLALARYSARHYASAAHHAKVALDLAAQDDIVAFVDLPVTMLHFAKAERESGQYLRARQLLLALIDLPTSSSLKATAYYELSLNELFNLGDCSTATKSAGEGLMLAGPSNLRKKLRLVNVAARVECGQGRSVLDDLRWLQANRAGLSPAQLAKLDELDQALQ